MTETLEPVTEKPKPKKLPQYHVIVENDDQHTYLYVIETLIKVFAYAPEKCYKYAEQVDKQGEAIVWTGHLEAAELKRDLIRGAGPDFYGKEVVKFPLGVRLEAAR